MIKVQINYVTGEVQLVDVQVSKGGGSSGGGFINPSGGNTNSFEATVDSGVETVTGLVNGSNKLYTTQTNYVAGLLRVFVNGVLQEPTTDYTETTDNSFTMVVAPSGSDVVLASYPTEVLNVQGEDVVYEDEVDDTGTYKYYGQANPGVATSGSTWRIRRLVWSTLAVQFADGNANFDNIWDNRAGYTYV